ncbi:MAG: poly(beta-D-mannuronate) lyase, partial [Cellvibrionaceae bacterium]
MLCTPSIYVQAKDRLVTTQAEYKKALKLVEPGDKIILKNGTWQNFEVLFMATGTANAPIELTAET